MAALALADQAALFHLPAMTGPEVTTLAAQFLALAPLIALAEAVANIKGLTGRNEPDVIS